MNNTKSASCSIEPDSRKSARRGWLDSLLSALRESCAKAMTGTFNSIAIVLNDLEISDTSTCLDSGLPPVVTNCK